MLENERVAKLTELAELGFKFKNQTLMYHFLVQCGREDDQSTKDLNQSRMDACYVMDDLHKELFPEAYEPKVVTPDER
jgi:hypothetical protein